MTQNTARKDSRALVPLPAAADDGLTWWMDQYFALAVTTSPALQTVQRRDLGLFLRFMQAEAGTNQRMAWTPRLSRVFQQHLQQTLTPAGRRAWSDKTIVRMLAHLKTFAKWVHTHRAFPLGNPMAALKLPTIGTGLEVERALTAAERRRLLDAADLFLTVGGRSKDRKRYKRGERPQRKGYRPYRNRAMIYTLIETGMRRAAITQLNLDQVDLRRKMLTVVEKGGYTHTYPISREGAQAIQDYLTHERGQDAARWPSLALFLAAATVPQGTGRLMGGGEYRLECRVSGGTGGGADAPQRPACHGEAHYGQDGECGRDTTATRAPAGRVCHAVCPRDHGGTRAGARRALSPAAQYYCQWTCHLGSVDSEASAAGGRSAARAAFTSSGVATRVTQASVSKSLSKLASSGICRSRQASAISPS
jgi:site-specific recombinase XerD